MSEAKKAQDGAGEGTGKPGKALGALPGLLLAGANLAVLGVGAFLCYSGTLGYAPPVLREPQALEALRKEREAIATKGEPVLYAMEPFTANLGGSTKPQMIRVRMTLQMLDQDGFEEVMARNPAARDSIVRILNAKTFADVESIQGKLYLKDQITTALNGFLKRGIVKDVYFSDFVIQ